MKFPLKLSAAVCSLCTTPLVLAVDIEHPRVDEEIIVTATLTEKNVFEVMGGAAVVTAQDISRIQPANLSELLDLQTGLDITRNGGALSVTSLFSRGTSSDHTLLLINGQRFNSATIGSTAFQVIDPEQITRVEILRGSRSSLYGSDAIGGVVQIFTDKQQEGTSGFLTMEEGSNDLQRLSVGRGYGDDKISASASLSYEESNGIDNFGDDTGFNADTDPYKVASSNVFISYIANESLSISFSDVYALSESDYDSQFSAITAQPFSKSRLRASAVDFDIKVSESIDSKVSVGRSNDESNDGDRQQPENGTSAIETERYTAYWRNNIVIKEHLVATLGAEYTDENVESRRKYEVEDRQVKAGFAQLQWDVANIDVLMGVRNDEHSDFGGAMTGSFSTGVAISDHYRVYANWNEGFKAPTFNDLHWPGQGNPDLLPESSTSRELGFKAMYPHAFFEINVFENDVKNLIAWAPNSDGIWMPTNINAAEIQGSEIAGKLQFDSWYVATSFVYLDVVDAQTEENLPGRARRKYSVDVNKSFEKLNVGVLAKLQSERAVSFGAPIPGYGTLDLYLSYPLSTDLALRIKLNNILDKDYQIDERYNTDGRNGSIKLTYSF